MKYKIVIKFETDRPLTPEEQFQIVGACEVQVEEPVDGNGDDLDVRVGAVSSRISEA